MEGWFKLMELFYEIIKCYCFLCNVEKKYLILFKQKDKLLSFNGFVIC